MAGSGTTHLRGGDDCLLSVENLVVEFPLDRRRKVHAVSDVSFDVRPGETLGLVGESGCGKSTVGRTIIRLNRPTSGSVRFKGTDLVRGRELREVRTRLQMIFQDPISSLNPRRKISDIVAEGLRIWGVPDGTDQWSRVRDVLLAVGLDPDTVWDRRPHELSGGQCQRVSIARALVLNPELIICDEPVSALDVSVQAQILNLLEDLKADRHLALLFIAHDLAVVKSISDRIAVMYLGKLCEVGPAESVADRPLHPYTAALLASVPEPEPDAVFGQAAIIGELPSPIDPPSGCRFRTRCPFATDRCRETEPVIRELAPGHFVACHHPLTPGGTDGSERPETIPVPEPIP
jgi:peptide/nickel transport system ATP-binding protein